MASDPFSTLGPSDSGFLNSFLTPNPSVPLQSRVGEDAAHVRGREADAVASDRESVLESDAPPSPEAPPAATPTVTPGLFDEQGGPTDGQLDAMLRAAPLPEGFLARMRRISDEP